MCGCIDTASRKVIWPGNCGPKRTARWYFNYLFQKRIVPKRLRTNIGHNYSFPENYGLEGCGLALSKEELQQVWLNYQESWAIYVTFKG